MPRGMHHSQGKQLMKTKNLKKEFICPACKSELTWGNMVKHIAYEGDSAHERLRIENDLPAVISFGHVSKQEPSVRLLVVGRFSQVD